MNALRSLHRAAGLLVLLAFLLSGAYMRYVAHPSRLPDGAHLTYLSRHIYILANALVHLVLGTYVVQSSTRRRRAAQWLGSGLLAISSVLLISAFVVEAVGDRARTPASSYGLYSLFAGALLHFAAGAPRSSS